MKTAILILAASCLVSAFSARQAEPSDSVTLIAATDLHYLSSSLYDNGSAFASLMAEGDGKLTEYSIAILDQLIARTEEENADALILSGDLTFNGEYQSLIDLKKRLLTLSEKGIPVLVIPGNHDIDCPYADSYFGSEVQSVAAISAAQFKEEMSCFGYDDALYKEENSFSYCYALRDDLWLVCMDANTEEAPGAYTEDEIAFLKKVLTRAEEQNARVILVSHQNVLPQSGLLSEGFVITNHDEVSSLLKQHDVSLVLSGHSHLQHETTEDGLTDICTESLAVAPLQYGLVQVDDQGWSYRNRTLGILADKAEERFASVMNKQLTDSLADLDIPDAIQEEMIAYGIALNSTYFAGHDVYELLQDERLSLWKEYGSDTFWYQYLLSMKQAGN